MRTGRGDLWPCSQHLYVITTRPHMWVTKLPDALNITSSNSGTNKQLELLQDPPHYLSLYNTRPTEPT